MKEYPQRQRHWLGVERLPGYAPDLKPVEMLWSNIKGQELANRRAEGLPEIETAIREGMRRVGATTQLAFSFVQHAGLSY
jgi:putative transposase